MDTEKISMDVKNISTANKTQTLDAETQTTEGEKQSLDTKTQTTAVKIQSMDAETQTTEGEKIIYATERNKSLLIAKENNLQNNKIFCTIKQNNYAKMNK